MHRESSFAAVLMLLLVVVQPAIDVQAGDLADVGVQTGDWADYCLRVRFSTNDSGPRVAQLSRWIGVERGRVEILSVVGANATYEVTFTYVNGSTISDVNSVNFSSGYMDHGPRWPIARGSLIPANLSVGDRGINATLMRYCAGIQREVNYFGLKHNISTGVGWIAMEGNFYYDRASGIFVEEDVELQYLEENYLTNVTVASIMTDTNIWTSVKHPLIPVSFGSSVTVYEKTTNVYAHNFSVSHIISTGAAFYTSAYEHYNVTSDGTYLKIHCFRDEWRSGLAVGNNLVAVRLDGVPSCPDGLWATVIVNYTLGFNGIAESRFNALGPDTQMGPYIPVPGAGLCTRLGDQHSEIIIGFNNHMPDIGAVCNKFGTNILDPHWDPTTDVNDDCKVDMQDIGFVCRNFERVLFLLFLLRKFG